MSKSYTQDLWQWVMYAVLAELFPLAVGGLAIWWDVDRLPRPVELLGTGALGATALVLFVVATATWSATTPSLGVRIMSFITIIGLCATAVWCGLVIKDVALLGAYNADRIADVSIVFFLVSTTVAFSANVARVHLGSP